MKKDSPWKLGGLTWKDLGRRVWDEMSNDDIWGRSAQMAYYFLLALFPLLFFLTSIIGLVLGAGTGIRHELFNYLESVLPPSAYDLVSNTMRELSSSSGGDKVTFGLLAALWAASNGMGAISESLNAVYDVKESRPWWKSRLIAIGLTIAIAILIISALVLVLSGGRIADALAGYFGFSDIFTVSWKILQWPLVLAFVLLAFALLYYFAPDLKDQKWTWVTPGSVIGVLLWLAVSFAFRVYLHFFDSYSATYGSLGAVIILMLWFYLSGAAILIGGEVNSEIENAAAESGVADAKEKGEKAPGEKVPSAGKTGEARKASNAATPSVPRRVNARAKGGELSAGKVVVAFAGWLVGKIIPGRSRPRI